MSRRRITVSIPEQLLGVARREVDEGQAESVSAVVTSALADRAKRKRMEQVLDEIEAEHGAPSPEAEEWARRTLDAVD